MQTLQRLFPERVNADKREWLKLLAEQQVRPAKNIDAVYGLFEEGEMIATGSRYHNILKCLAVSQKAKNGTAFNKMSSALMNEVFQLGFTACYVYTTYRAKDAFLHLGFREIAHLNDTFYFLENAQNGLSKYLENLAKRRTEGKSIAAIVMNANPFTNGHLYLVEKAAKENDTLHLFVLSEDLSQFSATTRLLLVKRGVAHLKNVCVHVTKDYMVSGATFPAYFLPEDSDVTETQALLDAHVFKKYIVPTLGITHRYVGSEPLSPTTHIYNQAMAKEFEHSGPKLVIIERLSEDQAYISASRVRQLFNEDKLEDVKRIVPATTYEYLLANPRK